MAENHYLTIYTLSEDGLESAPFLDPVGIPMVLRNYTYQAQRMGTSSIEATVKCDGCLDGMWTGREFVEFRGVRYFLMQTPTSTKDNSDARYSHKLNFESERDLLLGSVYFYDAIAREDVEAERYISNSTTFKCFCTLREFCRRFDAVLSYRGISASYGASVDDGVEDEEKFIFFEDKTLMEALQEAYKVWEVPYYFDGLRCRFGRPEDSGAIEEVFEYGHDAELLGLTHENSGETVLNHVTGYGSEDNIPYWYPNETPKGTLEAVYTTADGRPAPEVSVDNQLLFCNRVDLNRPVRFHSDEVDVRNVTLNGVPITRDAPEEVALGRMFKDYGKDRDLFEPLMGVGERTSVNCELKFDVVNLSGKDIRGLRIKINVDAEAFAEVRTADPYGNVVMPTYAGYPHDSLIYYPDADRDKRTNKVGSKYVNIRGIKVYRDGYGATFFREGAGTMGSRSVYRPNKRRKFFDWEWNKYSQYEDEKGDWYVYVDIPKRTTTKVRVVYSVVMDETIWSELKGDMYLVENTPISMRPAPLASQAYTSAKIEYAAGRTYWEDGEDVYVTNMEDLGLSFPLSFIPEDGDTIQQRIVDESFIRESKYLLPSIYRDTLGRERFYRASNERYTVKDTYDRPVSVGPFPIPDSNPSAYYKFPNPFNAKRPREHIEQFEDIKPSIKNVRNANGDEIGVIDRIYFEPGYDPTKVKEGSEDQELEYPYFFIRLRPTDGEMGFNLFASSIEEEAMTICMTSGHCGSCEFEVVVTEKFQWNPVKTQLVEGDDGLERELLLDEDGRVILASEEGGTLYDTDLDPDQQDSSNPYGVWLALRTDQNTYGGDEDTEGIMPGVRDGVQPHEGDSFVILHIMLPNAYILAAEKKLEEEIVKFMYEHNEDKFKFTGIKPSRIWMAENSDVRESLDEHSSLKVRYDGIESPRMFVTSYTYKVNEKDVLPEISFEVSDKVDTTGSTLQRKIDAVKSDLMAALLGMDILSFTDGRYIRSDDDTDVDNTLTIQRRLNFGTEGSGVSISGDGETEMTVDRLNVRKKATFSVLDIQKMEHSGGKVVLSPGAATIERVERTDDAFRCYIRTSDAEGFVENPFVTDDLVMCRTFNDSTLRYYWRKVTDVGDDYIDLSMTICDEGSDEPQENDTIVQFGNISDTQRQSIQVLSTIGSDAPSYLIYRSVGREIPETGLPDWSLDDKVIAGVRYDEEQAEPVVFSYGSMYFGDRDPQADGSTYVTFQRPAEGGNRKMFIKADVQIGGGSTGITNFSDYEKAVEDTARAVELGGVNLIPGADDGDGWLLEKAEFIGGGLVIGGDSLDNAKAVSPVFALTKGNYTLTMDVAASNTGNSLFVSIGERTETVRASISPVKVSMRFSVEEDYLEVLELLPFRRRGTAEEWYVSGIMLRRQSDLEYLKETLGDGSSTEIGGGVVLTNIVGVKDANGAVNAMLNGSDEFSDPEHGRLVIAAGSSDGLEHIESATTRIYEDGHVVTRSAEIEGKVTAKSGNIGGFEVGDDFLRSGDDTAHMDLSAAILDIEADTAKAVTSIVMKGYPTSTEDGFTAGRIDSKYIPAATELVPERNVALELEANGANYSNGNGGNFAILARKGFIGGLRPATRIVTANTNLTEFDHNVIVKTTSNITINLISNPEVGHTVRVFKVESSGTLTVQAGTKTIINLGSFPSGITKGLMEYLWDGSEWIRTISY